MCLVLSAMLLRPVQKFQVINSCVPSYQISGTWYHHRTPPIFDTNSQNLTIIPKSKVFWKCWGNNQGEDIMASSMNE